MQLQRRKMAVAWLSVGSNAVLVAAKLSIGTAIGSVSVLSEAIHSGVDLLAALIALFAVRTAGQPADERHPFGHGKIENISGTIEALLIFVAGGWIIWEAIDKLRAPRPLDSVGWGVGVMLFSSAVNWAVSGVLFRVGRQTDSVALQADGWHLRTDVWTSAGVMGGLGLIWVGGRLAPGLALGWLDPVAAIAVALLILRAAWRLTVESGRDLLDANLPAEEEAWIRRHLAGLEPPVRAYHRLRTRKAGATRFVEFHMQVSPELSVAESHRMSHEIAGQIRARFPASEVNIHIEPFGGDASSSSPSKMHVNPKHQEND